MNRVTQEQIQDAKKLDLLTYLKNYEPNKLVKLSSNTYCTKEHNSLKISNGKWCWFSKNIGGRSALDYLIKVEGYRFVDAVELIVGKTNDQPPEFSIQAEDEPEDIYMQPLNSSTDRIEAYLRCRGIHEAVIRYCIDNKLLFETENYHSALFVGYDKEGRIRYASQRGTLSSFKGENVGSDKRFSFNIEGLEGSDTVHVFESAIDLMSFASILCYEGREWRMNHLLSLSGVYINGRKAGVQAALEHFLDEHPNITTIKLHLDNDEAGQGAAACIIDALKNRYMVFDEPPAEGKDVNEYLCFLLKERSIHND